MNNNSSLPKISFAFLDLFALNVINLLLLQTFDKLMQANYNFAFFCIVNNIVWIICSYIAAVYKNNKRLEFGNLFKRILLALLIFVMLDVSFMFSHSLPYFNTFIITSMAGFAIYLLISRVAFIYIGNYFDQKEHYQKKIVFLGFNHTSQSLINYFEKNNKSIVVSGFFEDDLSLTSNSYPILGTLNDCIAYAIKNKITEIYATISPKSCPQMNQLAKAAEINLIKFNYIPDLSDYTDQNCRVDFINNSAIISLRHDPVESFSDRVKKRLFDIVFSSLIIVFILSWLLPILAIIIKFDSEGPVFFIQKRSGKNNLPFSCIKLRSLSLNRDADLVQVSRNDTRITKFGGFLRKSSLDELPQFFNVLFGNMSIVGSRPHMLKHTEEYAKIEDNYMIRHLLKPGVTGWAQINGHRGEIKHREQLTKRIEHDIWYVKNRNMWLDLRIVLATVSLTFKGDDNAF